METVKTLEIQICTIHYVERPRSRNEQIQNVHIVHCAVGNMDKLWYAAPQVHERMKFDGTFGLAKASPRE